MMLWLFSKHLIILISHLITSSRLLCAPQHAVEVKAHKQINNFITRGRQVKLLHTHKTFWNKLSYSLLHALRYHANVLRTLLLQQQRCVALPTLSNPMGDKCSDKQNVNKYRSNKQP